MKWHTTKTRLRAIDLYTTSRMSTREVAEAVGANKQTVCEWMRQEGVIRTRNEARRRDEQARRRVMTLYLDHEMSSRAVAQATGISPSTVMRWLRKAGVMRSRSAAASMANRRYTWADVKRVGVFREGGVTYSEISRRTGFPMGSLASLHRRFLRELDPPSRSRPGDGVAVRHVPRHISIAG